MKISSSKTILEGTLPNGVRDKLNVERSQVRHFSILPDISTFTGIRNGPGSSPAVSGIRIKG
jgi:hypothetical protein